MATATDTDLHALEEKAADLQQQLRRHGGQYFETRRIRYAGVLHEIARHRPLSVYELMHCGLNYPEACRVADATGGERTDKTDAL